MAARWWTAAQSPAIRRGSGFRFNGVPPEPESETMTAEAIAIQTITENAELAKQYAGGDLAVLSTLEEKALAIAAGRLDSQEVKDTLMRKLGASY